MRHETRQLLVDYCQMGKRELISLCDWYAARDRDGGVLGFRAHPDGDAKILVVAHIDYLGTGKVHCCNRKRVISSALDDRAGVFVAFELLPMYGIKADILLTDVEEWGDSTITMFGQGMLNKYNWIVQLDRHGEDAVTYGYTEMKKVLAEYWKVSRGTRSDIAYLEEICPVGAFNLGVGYRDEHRETCELSWKMLTRQMMRFRDFYTKYVDTRFPRKHEGVEWYFADMLAVRREEKERAAARKLAASKVHHNYSSHHHYDVSDWGCDWCEADCGEGGTTYVQEFSAWLCPTCKKAAGTPVKAKKIVVKLPFNDNDNGEYCDICRTPCSFADMRWISGMNWWACPKCCPPGIEPCVDDDGALILADPHGTDEGGQLKN